MLTKKITELELITSIQSTDKLISSTEAGLKRVDKGRVSAFEAINKTVLIGEEYDTGERYEYRLVTITENQNGLSALYYVRTHAAHLIWQSHPEFFGTGSSSEIQVIKTNVSTLKIKNNSGVERPLVIVVR